MANAPQNSPRNPEYGKNIAHGLIAKAFGDDPNYASWIDKEGTIHIDLRHVRWGTGRNGEGRDK